MSRLLRPLLLACLLAGLFPVLFPTSAQASHPASVPTSAQASHPASVPTSARASHPAAVPSSVAAGAVPGPVVLIGTGGIRWDDVDADTPALYSLLESGSAGWLAVRSVRSTTCPTDGWLAVSAGKRAADAQHGPRRGRGSVTEPVCREPGVVVPDAGGTAVVPGWQTYRQQADKADFDATPGVLGDTLARAGTKAVAIGPGAAIALATSGGTVAHAWAGGTEDGGQPGTLDTGLLSSDLQAALATDPDLVVVDIGAVRDPAQLADDEPRAGGSYDTPRAEQVQQIDTRLGLVLGQLQSTGATVIVASLADSGRRSRLQLVGAAGTSPGGPAYADSLLGSPSTRQDGLAQGTDILPTVLAGLGVTAPDAVVGSPLKPVDVGGTPADRLEHLDDIDSASTQVTPIVPIFFNGWVIAQILLYGTATIVLRRNHSRGQEDGPAAALSRRRTLGWLRRGAVVFACVPAATYLANLVPWWRAPSPALAVTLAVAGFVVPIALFALLGPWRNALLGPLGAVGGVTALVLAADAATGSHLALSSLMGVQPVVAGRFYGFGNVAFALFATGSLLFALSVADHQVRSGRRRAAVWAVGVIGLLAVVVDGTPGLGSDFGGPPAIIPAFAVLALLIAGVRITWRRALLIFGVTVGVLVLICFLDWLRPPADRTHLGRFAQTVIDGGAWSVVRRKADQNVRILFTSWLSALLPFAVAFVVLVLARPVAWGVRPLQLAYDRSPVLKHGVAVFGLMLLIGFAANDSGTVVPAIAGTLAIPLLISASVRALELADGERLDAAVTTARKGT